MTDPRKLIRVLLDRDERLDERMEAAWYLGDFDDPDVEQALSQIAVDYTAHTWLAHNVGDSLGDIWTRTGRRDPTLVARMHPAARAAAQRYRDTG
jgi:hypothetical protein